MPKHSLRRNFEAGTHVELVLELDAAFADSSLESADLADPSQELTCVDIDTFLANF